MERYQLLGEITAPYVHAVPGEVKGPHHLQSTNVVIFLNFVWKILKQNVFGYIMVIHLIVVNITFELWDDSSILSLSKSIHCSRTSSSSSWSWSSLFSVESSLALLVEPDFFFGPPNLLSPMAFLERVGTVNNANNYTCAHIMIWSTYVLTWIYP